MGKYDKIISEDIKRLNSLRDKFIENNWKSDRDRNTAEAAFNMGLTMGVEYTVMKLGHLEENVGKIAKSRTDLI